MVSAEDAPLFDDFTPEKISSFVCSLTENGEYYRAYVELLRFKSFYPSFIDDSVFNITSNYLFYKGKRYSDIIEIDSSGINDSIYIPFSLFRIDSLIRLDKKNEAESELVILCSRPDSDVYAEYLKKRSLYLSVLNNRKSTNTMDTAFSGYKELLIYSDSIYEQYKNPFLGAVAGVIPGMGYIYAGESGTGIVSMIVIGAGSAVTYASYNNGMDSLAVVSGLITFFFYGGSIAGGYMQTVKYNDRLLDTLKMKLDRELLPEIDLDEIYFKFGLNSNDCR
jgi:hypothetical protein